MWGLYIVTGDHLPMLVFEIAKVCHEPDRAILSSSAVDRWRIEVEI